MHFSEREAVAFEFTLRFESFVRAPIGVARLELAGSGLNQEKVSIGEEFPKQLLGFATQRRANEDTIEIGVMVFLLVVFGGMGVEGDPREHVGHALTLDEWQGKASPFRGKIPSCKAETRVLRVRTARDCRPTLSCYGFEVRGLQIAATVTK